MNELLQCKFLIYDNQLLMGKVQLHKHLLPDNYNRDLIKGGGKFKLNFEDQSIYFFGKSYDFGYFNKEDVTVDKLPNKFKNFSIRFEE